MLEGLNSISTADRGINRDINRGHGLWGVRCRRRGGNTAHLDGRRHWRSHLLKALYSVAPKLFNRRGRRDALCCLGLHDRTGLRGLLGRVVGLHGLRGRERGRCVYGGLWHVLLWQGQKRGRLCRRGRRWRRSIRVGAASNDNAEERQCQPQQERDHTDEERLVRIGEAMVEVRILHERHGAGGEDNQGSVRQGDVAAGARADEHAGWL